MTRHLQASESVTLTTRYCSFLAGRRPVPVVAPQPATVVSTNSPPKLERWLYWHREHPKRSYIIYNILPICCINLLIIHVRQAHHADIVIFHDLRGQLDDSYVVLEGFRVTVVGMEDDLLDLHLLGRGAALPGLAARAVRVRGEVVLAHAHRGQAEAAGQLRDAVGGGEHVARSCTDTRHVSYTCGVLPMRVPPHLYTRPARPAWV